jgi:predicted nucleic acid-binding protein
VISYLQQIDSPQKTDETLKLWDALKTHNDIRVAISSLAISEISKCAEPKLSFITKKLSELAYDEVDESDTHKQLAQVYLSNGVLGKKSEDDLRHIAVAVLSDCRYILSWNFKHFVNPKTIAAVNYINYKNNLPPIDILSPEVFLGGL